MIKLKIKRTPVRSYMCECESRNCDFCSLGNFSGNVSVDEIYDLIKNPPPMPYREDVIYTYKREHENVKNPN